MSARVGVVAIGRNEGKRLFKCLDSLTGQVDGPIVYVDSGSSDDSVQMAKLIGAFVVELDNSIPFTAARARNMGFERLVCADPGVEFVQFVDGDCRVVAGWIERAVNEISSNERTAVICGRRRELNPSASIYNQLCDLEWEVLLAKQNICCGDAMMRVTSFHEVGGFDASLIAGEEPELCVRLRQHNYQIVHLQTDMTIHDAAMYRFGQWWKRAVRAGHAYAQGMFMHGRSPQRHCVRETCSIWFWGLVAPLVALAGAWPSSGISLLVLLGYPLLGYRVFQWLRRQGALRSNARIYAVFCVLAKFPQLVGQSKFLINRAFQRDDVLIEYK